MPGSKPPTPPPACAASVSVLPAVGAQQRSARDAHHGRRRRAFHPEACAVFGLFWLLFPRWLSLHARAARGRGVAHALGARTPGRWAWQSKSVNPLGASGARAASEAAALASEPASWLSAAPIAGLCAAYVVGPHLSGPGNVKCLRIHRNPPNFGGFASAGKAVAGAGAESASKLRLGKFEERGRWPTR